MSRLIACIFTIPLLFQSHPCRAQTGIDLNIGQSVVKEVEHGRYVQYVPKSVDKDSSLLVVCHGMFNNESGTAEESAKGTIKHWFDFGEKHQLIVVAPIFDNENYACSKPGAFGGYRTLTGRIVGADQFLHEVIAFYQKMNENYDGRFFLFGHSAGAQFANRYVVRYPERVLGAVISSPAWFSFPDKDKRWAEGMAARKSNFTWGDSDEKVKVDVTPDPQTWLAANLIPITVVVGALDTDELKDTGKNHVTQATDWVDQMNDYAAKQSVESRINLKIVKGVGHNLGKLSRAGSKDLAKTVRKYYADRAAGRSTQNNGGIHGGAETVRIVSLNSIPDLTQTMKSAQFAGGGSQFCAPVAASNSLVWLEGKERDQRHQIELVKKLASPEYMNTKLTDGTGTTGLMKGIKKHAEETWGKYNRLEYSGWRNCLKGSRVSSKPTLKWMVEGLHDQAAVLINVGWYVKKIDGSNTNYERVGGHWVTMVGHANGKLILHDPGHRSGAKPRKEHASFSCIPFGMQTGEKSGLPVDAAGSIELTQGMPMSSKGNTAIIDGVVVFELSAPEPFRNWTSADGKFSIDARFVGVQKGKVNLEAENGRIIEIKIEKLNEQDQRFIKRMGNGDNADK